MEDLRKERSIKPGVGSRESGVEKNTTPYSLLPTPPKELPLPPEPAELRAETRAFVEESPEEGIRFLNDGHPLADLLWEEWGARLEGAGMGYERFLQITRGYSGEIRLWVMGERPWDHAVTGLAGRLLRRLPEGRHQQEAVLASCGESQ